MLKDESDAQEQIKTIANTAGDVAQMLANAVDADLCYIGVVKDGVGMVAAAGREGVDKLAGLKIGREAMNMAISQLEEEQDA